ncbi:uncharacterized protein LOC123543986 [Mercenaria mercenaria]|uniref:uncharacterized protein LOC123543986 n=1 Tax=Mercenaria mercenaria TaxID=6596 RepID=UPI001E1D77CE|nr:uncharacterized protein LOC123543986 [Mercenaria mercenaria]
MELKLLLALVLFACIWLTDGCNRAKCIDLCTGNAKCRIKDPRCKQNPDRRQKGSVNKNGTEYSITLQDDPCSFNTYDSDQDGAIAKRELHALLGDNEETDALFRDLNIKTDNRVSVITPSEFSTMAPQIITECADSDE